MADTIKIVRCDHPLADEGEYFTVNPLTRAISHPNPKSLVLIQGDANSEVYTIKLPKLIDSHPVDGCNRVEIHYINAGSDGETLEDIYEIAELKVYPDDTEHMYAEWILSGNTAMYNGTLSFAMKFKCTTTDVAEGEEVEILYSWNTLPFTGISVGKTINNTESVYYQSSDIIVQWYDKLMSAESMVTDVDNRVKALETQLAEFEEDLTTNLNNQRLCIANLPYLLWLKSETTQEWVKVYVDINESGDGYELKTEVDSSGPRGWTP